MKLTIDKLTFNDLQGLKELYDDAFEGSVTDYDKMIESYNQFKSNDNYNFLCARMNEKVVGSVLGVVCYELFGQCKPFMVLEDVAVLKSHRRMGIAKQLMKEIELIARQKECTMILFVSSQHRTGAHQLYESLGYGLDKVNGYRKRLT